MIRRFVVWFTAWTLRRGVTEDEMLAALRKAFPWRDGPWRIAVLIDARARNGAREIDA